MHCPQHLKYTWNAFKNPFHPERANGPQKRKNRFDRCCYMGEMRGKRLSLLGDEPVDEHNRGCRDYISDHFGIAVQLDVTPAPKLGGDIESEI